MKQCEVCGTIEGIEENETEVKQSHLLHVCEKCQNDRKYYSNDPKD